MRYRFFSLLLLICLASCHFKRRQADLVVHNATIYTVNDGFTTEQAMAIKDGKIIAIGKERDILNNFRYRESIDARKQFIYPGFIDAHCHFFAYGLGLQQVNLTGTKNFREVLSRITEFREINNRQEWIIGRGWDHTDWPGKAWPTKDTLDLLYPHTPVLLQRIDGHASLANQAALDKAGFTINTRIPGGIIEIKDGKLTGLLKENAVDSLSKFIPAADSETRKKALLDAQKKCFEVGLTTVDDAGLDKKDISIIEQLQKSGELQMRIYAMVANTPENLNYFLVKGPVKTDRLNIRSFKFYADGSLGSRSACLLFPYHDEPGESGIITIPLRELEAKAAQLSQKGFQVNTHCIGDSANRAVLKIYARVLKGTNDKRWRIEHAQVVNPDDLAWFKNYNIIPSVQSTHATSDMKWAGERLGPTRLHHAYAYKQLLQQNGLLVLGTDFPVEDINPLNTFYAAVFRKNSKGEPANGFLPENALSREETLKAMTIWAAVGNFEETEKGSLEPGKWADFVILDKDIMKVEEKDFLKTRVKGTFVAGKKVY